MSSGMPRPTETGTQAGRSRARPPKPADVIVSPGSIVKSIKEAVTTGGDIARFSWQVVRALPDLRHYPTEVFHQCGVLILSSGLIIWMMQFVMGYECGLEGNYTLKQIGAPLYSGIFNAWCGIREMAPYMWGYIISAKVGCGLVAEIGSMRISDEIDAMEVMGVKSRSYLVGARVVAAWLALPFLYIVGLGIMYIGEYLTTVKMLGGVSEGGYSFIFWLYQNPADLLYSLVKVMAMGTAVVFVGCYYGYTASGGSVGVGRSTAKSMMLNMVLVHVIGVLGTQLFWGLSPNAPIAN
ncbi:ABC transporter permease [Prauserella oleivorans]|nr:MULTISPECIES: ABC transporter permease [Pseudonocardiaceae]MCF6427979.1 ABC transporter permease [Amycolatopsis tucumanensis]NIJ09660.1 phospholipid/cholesterol/gamma-HCH transport system permease protein [Saccharomonospora amisosensis]